MKAFIFILIILNWSQNDYGQCITPDSLFNRILFLRSSLTIKDNDQLQELEKYLQLSENCEYRNDSVFMFLLQRTAALISFTGNYEKAIDRTNYSNKVFNDRYAKTGMLPGIKIK